MMYRALVCCRAGIGSSMMLKIKVNQVISENKYPIVTEHSNMDAVPGFSGDMIISLMDVAEDLNKKNLKPYVLGINNIMDKVEIKKGLEAFLETKK